MRQKPRPASSSRRDERGRGGGPSTSTRKQTSTSARAGPHDKTFGKGPASGRTRPAQTGPARKHNDTPAPKRNVMVANGRWLWTTRPQAESDLLDELLQQAPKSQARIVAPSVVESDGAPIFAEGDVDTTFARQAFKITAEVNVAEASMMRTELLAHLQRTLALHTNGLAVSVFTPDADATNSFVGIADELNAALMEVDNTFALTTARDRGVSVFHVALASPKHAWVGTTTPATTVSYAEGGRARMRVAGDRPSRAARKVEEALYWLNLSPGAGEVCIDMGAAPGGWSWSLLEKRCRVIAIDPAELRPDIAKHPRLTHIKASAFSYAPDEPVDWLFGDMAWRPLEVAEMAAKWGRRRWARFLVMNFKLPMKKKWEIVVKIREILAGAGWKRVRTRQLYHDRDEITVTAHL